MNRKHTKEPRPAAVINNAGTVPTPLTDDEVKHITNVFNEVDDMQGMIADVNRRLKKLADLGIIAKMDQWTERRLRIERGEIPGEAPASFTDDELAIITETSSSLRTQESQNGWVNLSNGVLRTGLSNMAGTRPQ